MDKQPFCPFAQRDCQKNCMFYTHSSAVYPDNVHRPCLIASSLNKISDRTDDYFDKILSVMNSQ